MAKQVINVGTSANDGTGDPNRTAFQKINANFTELYDGVGAGDLQQVTDNGNRTTNEIISTTGLSIEAVASGGKVQRIVPGTGIPEDQNFTFPNSPGGGSLALTSDIPTVDATPTDGSSNAVSSNGVFDALANKVDKNATITGATKTKITYDSKGLVTSGADATTADVSDSTNKRYVTDSQLVVIGNTSGTNTGDQDLSALESKTVQTTGSVISFSTQQRYNSIASPTSGNITDNLTGARIGVVQKIFSNKATEPTYPAGWVKRGSGNYIPSTLNIIYAEWEEGTTVSYWITQ